MTITITPTSCFTPAIFYDVNHNPRNIPCEGPKVVSGIVNFSKDQDWIIDLSILFSQSQMSCVQSISMYTDGSFQASNIYETPSISIYSSGTGYTTTIAGINGIYTSTGGTVLQGLSFFSREVVCLSPPKIELFFYSINPSTIIDMDLNFQITNFMMVPVTDYDIFNLGS